MDVIFFMSVFTPSGSQCSNKTPLFLNKDMSFVFCSVKLVHLLFLLLKVDVPRKKKPQCHD